MRRTVAGLALIGLLNSAPPPAGLAQSPVPAIRFAPPVDQPLAYRVSQRIGTGKAQQHFESVRHLRFTPDRDGYRMTVVLHSMTGDAPADALARYRAALSPMVGMAQHLRIDGSGRVIAIDNLDAVWTAFMQGQRALLALSGESDARQAAFAHLERLDPAGRLAVLAGDVQPLMLFASGIPLASMRREQGIDAGTSRFSEADEARGLTAHYVVDDATGLVLRAGRDVEQPGRSVRETRLLAPMSE
ncbi:hypothetical protein [Sphingobium algorifonticola]|uniref:DUF4908 domain-containing protein n=1 Tax=Sphingobium algorifonticola TaxID=2008318 RepID=A0A437J5H3_9SPHN|nr:hypothetical protein [Sphingobium algorifonticola]RVT40200.1 hypothetical protein ENE74_12720 [Sphingobium algorifonticola]